MNSRKFRVALTGDFIEADGSPRYAEMGLSVFDGIDWIETVAFESHEPEITPGQIGDAAGVIVLSPRVTARTVSRAGNLLALVRFGVGYDSVDVEACTAADVAALTTPGAVDRSMAEATIGWMIALGHHLRIKDRLVREGGWATRDRYMGVDLRERTFGAVGFGGIARKTVALLSGFDMNPPIAHDPFVSDADAAALGVRMVGLDELMGTADFVSVHCPLTDGTRGLIGRREIGLMKPDAYLINTARGGIVDEEALFDALEGQRIAGAALDCFVGEPLTEPHALGNLDNVLLAPHCIAWTKEFFRDIGRAACRSVLDLAEGRRPQGVLNPQVFERRGFIEKWERLRINDTARSPPSE